MVDRIDIIPISDPVYKFHVNFIYGGTYQAFLDTVTKTLGRKPMKAEPGHTLGCFYHSDVKNYFFLWLPRTFEAHVLTHELVHLVMRMFHLKGVPIAIQNQETFAYHLEYWFEEVMRVVKISKEDARKGTIHKARRRRK